ncbi:uroporphyrinogen-III C-methyltransferase [Sphingomonas bacterium]|uniref:uroporphyrinogen-III C-methyltransferase n=1 Tax=Sphingomonas bacterium TaxID=1895847 RepID=UPI00266F0FAD|nr:SAM-dependent methyltransferase [Sphingomonas bacterium]
MTAGGGSIAGGSSFWTAGNRPTLFAAFLYFDFAFMVWVLLGPLGPDIARSLALDPAQKGFMGASLTLRGLARRLTFVTAHARAGETLDLDWRALADPDATLAVYMGKAAAGEVAERLIANGLPPTTPAVVVENASLPGERVFATRLDLLPLATATALGDGPAVLLIGKAMGQRKYCRAWLDTRDRATMVQQWTKRPV